MNKLKISLKNTMNGWVVLASLLMILVLVWLILSALQPDRALQPVDPANLAVIPAPTSTPKVAPTLIPTATATQPPVVVNSGDIAIGVYVQISGTGGDGLRIRSGAGLEFQPRFLGYEAEVFQVKDGPKTSDGYTWWYLVASYDNNRSGWAVENYLSVVAVNQ